MILVLESILKVVLLSGASSIHTIRWVNALAENGLDVYLISQHKPIEVLNSKVNFYEFPCKGMLGYYLYANKVRRLIEKINPDIINAHYASGYGTLARLVNIRPLLLSVWGSDVYSFPGRSFLHKSLVIKNLKFADRVASTSAAMAQQTNSLLNEKLYNIALTPFGVEFDSFKNIRYKNNSNEIIIGTIKGLEQVYGIDILIKAFSVLVGKLQQQNSTKKVFLEIVGKGSKEDELKALVRELNLEDKVIFSGRIEYKYVPDKLATFDIFVALSRVESFGVAVVEAHAARRPVVVSDVGGLPEVVANNISGFVVPCEDIEETSNKLEILVNNYDLRREMGEAGFNNALEKYSWDKNVQKMIDLYVEVING